MKGASSRPRRTPTGLVIGIFQPYDISGLNAFMHGLVAGGPTRSGHRTPPEPLPSTASIK